MHHNRTLNFLPVLPLIPVASFVLRLPLSHQILYISHYSSGQQRTGTTNIHHLFHLTVVNALSRLRTSISGFFLDSWTVMEWAWLRQYMFISRCSRNKLNCHVHKYHLPEAVNTAEEAKRVFHAIEEERFHWESILIAALADVRASIQEYHHAKRQLSLADFRAEQGRRVIKRSGFLMVNWDLCVSAGLSQATQEDCKFIICCQTIHLIFP